MSPQGSASRPVRVSLLGPFTHKGAVCSSAGPWSRPTGQTPLRAGAAEPRARVGREVACELLFANLGRRPRPTLSPRRCRWPGRRLSALGDDVPTCCKPTAPTLGLTGRALDIDLVAHEEALRSALAMEPGRPATRRFLRHWPKTAPCSKTSLMPTGPSAPRGPGGAAPKGPSQSWPETAPGARAPGPEAVIEAWEGCLAHDPRPKRRPRP